MSKRVLILSGSPRKGGNSDRLCDEFMRGAIDSGNQVVKIRVAEKNIGYCKSCYYCEKTGGECVIKDDMQEIMSEFEKADVIVMASPVYFYSICAQLKTVIDRLVAKWLVIKNKEFYYIATAGENASYTHTCTIDCFRGLAACLGGSVEKGVIKAGGLYELGAIDGTPYLAQAYEMGKNV